MRMPYRTCIQGAWQVMSLLRLGSLFCRTGKVQIDQPDILHGSMTLCLVLQHVLWWSLLGIQTVIIHLWVCGTWRKLPWLGVWMAGNFCRSILVAISFKKTIQDCWLGSFPTLTYLAWEVLIILNEQVNSGCLFRDKFETWSYMMGVHLKLTCFSLLCVRTFSRNVNSTSCCPSVCLRTFRCGWVNNYMQSLPHLWTWSKNASQIPMQCQQVTCSMKLFLSWIACSTCPII